MGRGTEAEKDVLIFFVGVEGEGKPGFFGLEEYIQDLDGVGILCGEVVN